MHVSLYDHYNNRMYKIQGRSLKVLAIIVLIAVCGVWYVVIFTFSTQGTFSGCGRGQEVHIIGCDYRHN